MTPTGAVIMGVFGAVWWVIGIRGSGNTSALMYGIPILITAVIMVAASRIRSGAATSREEDARRGRLVGIASGIEGLLILVAINVLLNIRKLELAAPVGAIIVGLHFLPLARWLPARLYYATSALLVALGLAGFVIANVDRRFLVVGIGSACVLWLTCLVVLRHDGGDVFRS
jgi:hypothetical protein